MGTIKVLESIQEQDLEERLSETSTFSSSSSSSALPSKGRGLKSGDKAAQDGAPEDHGHRHRHVPSQEVPSAKERTTSTVQVGSVKGGLENGVPISGKVSRTDSKAVNVAPPPTKDVPSTKPGVGDAGEGFIQQSARYQRPTFPLSAAAPGQQNPHRRRSSSKVSTEIPIKVKINKAEPRQRAESETNSTVSEDGESREVHTPLSSVTVTIKNRQQGVTSCTRLNNDVDGQSEVTDESGPSPRGFGKSAPCVTSTPRRRRSSTIDNSNAGKGRVNSSGRERSRSAVSPPGYGTPDSRENWIQDQILAMNSAFEGGEREKEEEETVKETNGDVPTCVETSVRKKSIQFSADVKDPEESTNKVKLNHQSSSERLLCPKKFDLDTETPRRFTFNKVTTRRLLDRVNDIISPELRSRIKTGDMGLKVSS